MQTVKNGDTVIEPVEPSKKAMSLTVGILPRRARWNLPLLSLKITLYAHWRKAGMVKVTFDANGGHFSDGSETTVKDIRAVRKLLFQKILKEAMKPKKETSIPSTGEYSDRLGEHKVDETYTVTEDITCYANWGTVDKFTLGTEEDPLSSIPWKCSRAGI